MLAGHTVFYCKQKFIPPAVLIILRMEAFQIKRFNPTISNGAMECQSSWTAHLYCLAVRVSRGVGFDSRGYQIFWVVVGMERDPLSLMRVIDELQKKVAAPVYKTEINGRRYPLHWPRNTLPAEFSTKFPWSLGWYSSLAGPKATEPTFPGKRWHKTTISYHLCVTEWKLSFFFFVLWSHFICNRYKYFLQTE
jgi:hypothetical protein